MTATLDRSPGTLASSGGTGRVGGALSSPNDVPSLPSGNGVVWVQGALTTASQYVLQAGSGDGVFVAYIGYGTTRGDGVRATITASANLNPIIPAANQIIFRNFLVDGANIADRGMEMGIDCYVENVQVTRCNLSGLRAQNEGNRIRRCLFTFNGGVVATGVGADIGTGSICSESEAHDNANGFSSSNGTGDFVNCISHNNTKSGFYQGGDDGMRLRNCDADANTLDGLRINDSFGITTMQVTNCLFTNNGGYGIRSITTDYSAFTNLAIFFQNNGFFGNALGNYFHVPAGATDVTSTSTPFTNAGAGDFSLNGIIGGGAAVMGAGSPGGIGVEGTGALASTSHIDIGAVQTLGAAPATSATVLMRNLWRELTNQRDTEVIPDSVVDIYLDWGLQELNRRLHYHYTTASDITLVEGVQEYTIPVDAIEIVWIQYGSNRLLEKGSVEQWRRLGEDWRNEPEGEPRFWAHYGNQFVIRPKPSNRAVADAPNLTIRRKDTPPSITTNGPEQLPTEAYRVVVEYGAYLWSGVYPDSVVAQQRAAALKAEFEASAQAMTESYARRELAL